MKRAIVWLTLPLVLAAGLLLLSFQAPHEFTRTSVAATYSHSVLRATIPYVAPRAGAGRLTLEVLDPEDQIQGRIEQSVHVETGKGTWQGEVKLTKSLSANDLVRHRLRYQFTYGDDERPTIEGTDSISQILRTPLLRVLGQKSYFAGGEAAVRVIVTDSKDEVISGANSLRIELLPPDQKPRVLFAGPLNHHGTAEAQFRFPAGLSGKYPLHYVVDTPIGSSEVTQQIRLDDTASILLTTEKPIYQPGQTIHVRALALDRSSHEAAAGRKLVFEVEDSRGNKVFKHSTQTSKFGIASAEFALADEVNLGTYHLRAIMDAIEGSSTNGELALNVETYVLPKFKVAIDFQDKERKTTHGYRPGDHVIGTVRANYFFGKPVDRAELMVKASSMDVAVSEVASVQGRTDADGAYRFDLKLPNYFAGRPLNQGTARVLIDATVKDATVHAESRSEPITVSESPLIVTAVPEGGTLIPDLENQIFILTSYADGKPASAKVRVHAPETADQITTTDSEGVAIVRLKPGSNTETIQIEANDEDGNHVSNAVELAVRQQEDQILLRTEHAIYRAGDRIRLRIFSTKERGTAYVDVVKEGQTILTRDLEIKNGQAELCLTSTPDMAGLAYQIVGRYFIPWTEKRAGEALSIGVAYDRTHLEQDDIAVATATVKSNLSKAANMVMVDLGIPPGFDLLSEDLQDYQQKSASRQSGRLEKFQLNADAGYSLFRFPCTGGHVNAALSSAGQISYPGSNIPVASL
jgi:hypothetical protein